MIIKEKGITNEVSTIFSTLTIEDIVGRIIEKKCEASLDWIISQGVNIKHSTIIGAYLTGMKLVEKCAEFSVVDLVENDPYLKNLINEHVNFYEDISFIKNSDLVIDTTGLGGVLPELIKRYVYSKVFLVEDPTSDGSDEVIRKKSNINKRIDSAHSPYKGLLKTTGLKAKTSGTMTLTMEVLRLSMEDILRKDGVLYAVPGMRFYERILFRQKDYKKFLNLLKTPAMIISSINPISPDKYIEKYIEQINCEVEYVGL